MNASDLEISPYRQDLLAPPTGAYLNTAAESPLLKSVHDGLLEYARHKAAGELGRAYFESKLVRARSAVAELLDGDPACVGFCYTASDAIALMAQSIPWRPGDRVVVSAHEFPSMLLPWHYIREQGVEVDIVWHSPEESPTSALLARIDQRTRLVATSVISYRTGWRVDLRKIRQAAHAVGALVLADATQALGVIPVRADEADMVVASAFKWLMGVHGVAVLYVARNVLQEMTPPGAGWRSVIGPEASNGTMRWDLRPDAQRFEMGMPGFPAIFALERGLAYLKEVGFDVVRRRVETLVEYLMRGIEDIGARALTPAAPKDRGGIVALSHDDAQGVVDKLASEGVYVFAPVPDVIRMSPHFYNDLHDCRTGLERTEAALSTRP